MKEKVNADADDEADADNDDYDDAADYYYRINRCVCSQLVPGPVSIICA